MNDYGPLVYAQRISAGISELRRLQEVDLLNQKTWRRVQIAGWAAIVSLLWWR